MKPALYCSAALVALLTLLDAARADPSPPPPVVGSATPLGDGLYKYQYTITNETGSYLWRFSLDWHGIPDAQFSYYYDKYKGTDPNAPFLQVTGDKLQYSPLLHWVYQGPEGMGTGEIATASFIAPFQPGTVNYSIDYLTHDTEGDGGLQWSGQGTVVGPVGNTAPEPATAVLVGLGSLSLAIARGGRRAGQLLFCRGRPGLRAC